MTAKAVDFVAQVSMISGFDVQKLNEIGFFDQAESLEARGITPDVASEWLQEAKIKLGEALLIKDTDLVRSGFAFKLYKDQDGIFITKVMRVGDMPYMSDKAVDEKYIFSESMATVDVGPDGRVSLFIPDSDYYEVEENWMLEDGWAIVKDALI